MLFHVRMDVAIPRDLDPDERTRLLATASTVEVLQRADGELLALFTDKWSLRVLERNKPHLTLTPMVAAELG